MRLLLRRCFAVSLLSLLAAGCGGSKPAEPSLSQQVEAAKTEPDAEIRARTLIDLSAQQRAIKDNPGANSTTTLALKSAQEVKNPAAKTEILLLIAKDLTTNGGSKLQANDAIEAARVAVTTIADRREKAAATIDLAISVKKLGEQGPAVAALNNAESLVSGVEKPEERAPLLGALAAGRILTGDQAKADEAVKSATDLCTGISDVRTRVRTQSAVAAALYGAEQPEAGKKFLDAAVDVARKISDPQSRAYALAEIFEALSPYRTRVPVSELLREAYAAANQITDLQQKGVVLQQLQALAAALK